MDINFCRRCSAKLTNKRDHVFECDKGHILFANANPSTTCFFINDEAQVLAVTRKVDPGKDLLDFPGGFCDDGETFEDALAREMSEELGLSPDSYTPHYITSILDPYPYKGEILPVLSTAFWAKLQPDTAIRPGDDVEKSHFLFFDQIDRSRIYFRSQLTILDKLHAMGILK